MGSRIHISLTVIAAWLIVSGMTSARADIVSCTCADACGCPDDDTSDTTQVTRCNGTKQVNCECAGESCPTGTLDPCHPITVCASSSSPYSPCGGKGNCPCGGSYCLDSDGPGSGTSPACNQHCNSAKSTACGAEKQQDGTWNENGAKLCSADGCGGTGCDCGRYHCKNSTAGPPDVKKYPCACWECLWSNCDCASLGECEYPGCMLVCNDGCDFDTCPCPTPGSCGKTSCTE